MIKTASFTFKSDPHVYSHIWLKDDVLGWNSWILHAKDYDKTKYTVSFNSRLNPSKRTISNQSKRRNGRGYKISNKAKGKLLRMASNLPIWAANRNLEDCFITVKFQYDVEQPENKLPIINDIFNITYELNDNFSIKYVKG